MLANGKADPEILYTGGRVRPETDPRHMKVRDDFRPAADAWHQIIYYLVNYFLIILLCRRKQIQGVIFVLTNGYFEMEGI